VLSILLDSNLSFLFELFWGRHCQQELILIINFKLVEILRKRGCIRCIKHYFFKFMFSDRIKSPCIYFFIKVADCLFFVFSLIFDYLLNQLINFLFAVSILWLQIIRRSPRSSKFPLNIAGRFTFNISWPNCFPNLLGKNVWGEFSKRFRVRVVMISQKLFHCDWLALIVTNILSLLLHMLHNIIGVTLGFCSQRIISSDDLFNLFKTQNINGRLCKFIKESWNQSIWSV